MEFKLLSAAVRKQFEKMAKGTLYTTMTTREDIWDTYLKSFPEGTNPIFKERTEHDCNCCKGFLRQVGNVVAIIDNKIVTIWDVEVGGFYQEVVDAMAAYVKSKPIDSKFYRGDNLGKTAGGDKTIFLNEDTKKTHSWYHFQVDVPSSFMTSNGDSIRGKARDTARGLTRSLTELTLDSAETVLELIEQDSIYRGQEHLAVVKKFITYKKRWEKLNKDDESRDVFVWNIVGKEPHLRFRSTVIGSLLVDLSDGKDLTSAVKSFEAKVAPTNYKRPKALVTKGMIDKAQKRIIELGYTSALQRRHAVTSDITINNVLYADRSAKVEMDVFAELKAEAPTTKTFDKIEEVSYKDFLEKILPKAESVELFLDNQHERNLFSLIAPSDPESKNMLKWDNNFSWSYNGEVADSMKEQVKSAGGAVDGDLRFSIQWNEDGQNLNDLDAHCKCPSGYEIFYSNRIHAPSGGKLDVDIMNPIGIAVENITFPNISRMDDGSYKFWVHNFSSRGARSGFTAEIETNTGEIHSFAYDKPLRSKENIQVATVKLKNGEMEVAHTLEGSGSKLSKEMWNINSQQFHKVRMIMNSPNHWDGEETGNKHLFFVLEDCKNDSSPRGFYNEFLKDELRDDRKVFEILGSKMRAKATDDQLSGVGFSTTQRNHVILNVSGKFNRTIKVKF